ncbi:MAG: hypothetical protein KF891_16910 [Rhizobacter sp.]|nr:hypothetical protein [Rhizobacter sp.]
MLENLCTTTQYQPPAYRGPERRTQGAPAVALFTRMLDEIDHGMLLVTPGGRLRHANQPAQRELARAGALLLAGQEVRAAQREQNHALLQALANASRGRRCMLTLGAAAPDLSVAVTPLGHENQDHEALVLLVLGKRQSFETLTLDFYARTQGLTDAEARVLQALCKGLRPKEVARQFNVAVSTIRSQISSIRAKTQTTSIRDLVNRVSTLPPIAPAIRPFWSH